MSEPPSTALWGWGAAVYVVLETTSGHCGQGCRLFKWCRNLPPPALWGRLLKRCRNLPPGHCWAKGSGCLTGVGTYLLSTAGQGCRVFKWCQFLLHQQVRGQNWILFYFYFRTDQEKPGHMQLLLLRSAFLFLLRELYIVRMSTVSSIILLMLQGDFFI